MVQSYMRAVILYGVLITVIRLMGKRQIGQMEASEFVVTMLVANLATVPMENTELSIYAGIVPILAVLGMELLLSWVNLRSVRLRRLLCGKPVILIENGNILQRNLRRTRVTLDELTGQLRQKDVLDIRAVQYAILETNGNLSVFPFPKERPASARDAGVQARKQYLPVTVVTDGVLLHENLKKAGKDVLWLQRVLKEKKATLENTWLLTVDGGGQIFFCRKEVWR